MRPIKTEFQAFGPYQGYECVDFESLAKSGLFLLCGKTGTGKTTILDSITFALFYVSSGNGRNDFMNMRCTKADDKTDTFVRFTFENNNNYYIFERRITKKQKNFKEECNIKQKVGNGEWQVVFENPKQKEVSAKAEEIIGLTADQFRQVIVMPQGQFEKFLVSNSKDKEEILSSIFNEDRWKGIAEIIYDEAEKRKNALNKIKEQIQFSLSEVKCNTIEELGEKVAKLSADLEKAEEDDKKADLEGVVKKQDELLALANEFDTLHSYENKLTNLEANKTVFENKEKQLEIARKAEKVSENYIALINANKNVETRESEVKSAEALKSNAVKVAKDAVSCYQEYVSHESENEKNKAMIVTLEGKVDDYKNIDSLTNSYNLAVKSYEKIANQEKQLDNMIEVATKLVADTYAEYDALLKEHGRYVAKYTENIAGQLAVNLAEGQPCPVCGSTTHPHKAEVLSGDITKDMVDAKKAEADKKYKEWGDKDKELKDKNGKKAELHKEVEAANLAVLNAKNDMENAQKSFVEGINSLSELETKIKALKIGVSNFDNQKKLLEENKTKAGNLATAAETKLNNCIKELDDAQNAVVKVKKEFVSKLSENGFDGEEEFLANRIGLDKINTLQEEISNYAGTVKATKENILSAKNKLAGCSEPNRQMCEEKKKEANDQIKANIARKTELSNIIKGHKEKYEELSKLGEGISDKIKTAEDDFTFAKKLRGDAGIGLQRYVLGIMFSSVVTAANNLLKDVHDGRFKLYRTDDKGTGNKRGLELKAYDKESPEHAGRPVGNLSGGEKFIVSLALAIGMSSVAQRSGIKIGAIFIDEGFGTLDDEYINDAMDMLRSVQNANGIVGIISHIQLLQERIPAKLQIVEDNKGSHIVSTVG